MSNYSRTDHVVPPPALQATVEAALVSREWNYSVKALDGGYRTNFGLIGETGTWALEIGVWHELKQVTVRIRPEHLTPSARRTEMALLLTRFNDGLVLGNFELDLDTGAICFKAALDCAPLPEVPVEAIEGLIDLAMRTGEVAISAIEAVLTKGVSAEQAYGDLGWSGQGDTPPTDVDPLSS